MKKYTTRVTVGITGHRNLLINEIPKYKEKIRFYLSNLQNEMEKPLLLVSPLADGADRIFIEAGKELGLDYICILPMPIHMYSKDFSEESYEEFNSLIIGAREHEVCDFIKGNSEKNCAKYGENRDKQYLEVGLQITQCDKLVVLWDGIDNGKTGGTSDIVNHRKNIQKNYYLINVKRES